MKTSTIFDLKSGRACAVYGFVCLLAIGLLIYICFLRNPTQAVPADVQNSLESIRKLDSYHLELFFKRELFERDNVLLSGEVNSQMTEESENIAKFGFEFYWDEIANSVGVRRVQGRTMSKPDLDK
jgi:hypothetical protein